MEPTTMMVLMGVSAGFNILGAYTGYQQAKYQGKAQQEQARIDFENSILRNAEEQNAIVAQSADIKAYNFAQSSGGESFEAALERSDEMTAMDVSAGDTSLILNQDATRRQIKISRNQIGQARTASLIKMGAYATGGYADMETAKYIRKNKYNQSGS
ncbi:hypothetical protein [uncultured Mediterranean phage uvMED]|nr:hypothetical protein [uncultured Mediterranean phage uvMED]BAR16582.1 hypothetical protein [uncultured Mediterranean phage uvMED]